jgi:hypothetical protein
LHAVVLVGRVVQLDGPETPLTRNLPDRHSAPGACGGCDQSAVAAERDPLRVLVVQGMPVTNAGYRPQRRSLEYVPTVLTGPPSSERAF